MKFIISALLALSVLAGIAAPASAYDPWKDDPGLRSPLYPSCLVPQAPSPAGRFALFSSRVVMRTYIPADAFGLLPAPPALQGGATELPEELTRLIRELEDLLDETKTTDASTSTSRKSTQSPPDRS
jgi:hypothetical protein